MLTTANINVSIGTIAITGSEDGIQSVKLLKTLQPKTKKIPKELQACAKQLLEYFDRKRESFDLVLDWGSATDFNISVWKQLLKIPYGQTTSYSAVANKINNPKAVRAVGLANRNNPIAFIVPCHRVISKSGHLQGYFYGLDTKRKLLELENPNSFAEQGELF